MKEIHKAHKGCIKQHDRKSPTYFNCSALNVSSCSFGASLGFRNCCDRDGRALYGRSCGVTLHSYE